MAPASVRLVGLLACVLVWWAGRPVPAQSTAATFGEVISLGGTPSDIVLDESRGRLYLVNSNASRVDIYSYLDQRLIAAVQVGNLPVAAAMSMDNAFLYVTNNLGSSLSVIDLHSLSSQQVVSLPARPEGVEVGADGRVLITCQGTTVGASILNTLLVYDKNQEFGQQLQQVPFPPPPPTPSPLPPTFIGRPTTTFRGKLIRTPDGQFIVGLSTINNNAQTILFVYETASATLLRSRTVTGQSTVLSMSPDGSRFMAGFTQYDTATLAVIGQQNTANAPFQMVGSFNTVQNVGGSTFSPDGETLYSAFNTAPFSLPAARPQSSTFLISSARNLGIRLGIRIPESIIAKMVITSDGAHAWGLSESGLIYLPLGTLYDYPILQPETTQVFLAVDPCNKGLAKATIAVNNLGKGKLTFSAPNTGAALVAQVSSGVAPATITFIMEPGRAGVNRQPGTNLYTGAAGNTGVALNVNLASLEAINIPNTIRVFMNYRNPDQRGIIFPVPTALNTSEGLQDVVLDELREKLYITNAGFNRIEVFDVRKQRFVGQIEVGQLPHQMALGTDGTTLYVANQGGESISIVDLELGRVVGQVEFPPIPRAGNANPITPRGMAVGLNGLQFIMSNGSQWKLVGNQATVRPANAVTPTLIGGPQGMMATLGFEYILTLGTQGGAGVAYLYDALVDNYTTSRTLFTVPIQSYFGPLGAAPSGAFFMANGLVLNSSLTVIGGAERPGAVQFGPPAQPGQPPTQTVVSAGQRNIASLYAIDDHTFLRLTTPVRQNVNITATRDELRPTLELVDIRTGAQAVAAVSAENPIFSVYGTQRINIPPRQMIVDSQGNAYLITISGLTFIPLAGSATRPQLRGGARAIVNSADATPNFRPGSFITIGGDNLAAPATADQIPLPTVLGGSCVAFSDVAIPLLQTSSGQISAQLPETLRPGLHVVQVRSLATAQTSDPVVVTVQRPE